jgi:serine/threonine protein kinase
VIAVGGPGSRRAIFECMLAAWPEPRSPDHLTAASQLPIQWQPVSLVASYFDFRAPDRRFNLQTQFFPSRGIPARREMRSSSRTHCLAQHRNRSVLCGPSANCMATAESTRTLSRHEASASDAPQLVGRLGPWQLVKPMGEGNLTRVYLARPADGLQNQPAAYVVKVLRKEWWRDLQAIEMQRREAWAGMKISHPNLLPVLSASVEEPPFYVVTPKLDGVTLAQLINERGRLGVPLALWISRQAAEGLAALFEETGMIHTDVKPANIQVSPAGHATLMDFGFVQTPAEASQWATRPLAGTLAYIAPEMVTSALAAGPPSDIYSLGVTLYEMLTGVRPWNTDDPAELAALHREAKPADIREHRPELTTPVAELVHSMLAKDPLRRPGSARELATRLVRLEIESFTLR